MEASIQLFTTILHRQYCHFDLCVNILIKWCELVVSSAYDGLSQEFVPVGVPTATVCFENLTYLNSASSPAILLVHMLWRFGRNCSEALKEHEKPLHVGIFLCTDCKSGTKIQKYHGVNVTLLIIPSTTNSSFRSSFSWLMSITFIPCNCVLSYTLLRTINCYLHNYLNTSGKYRFIILLQSTEKLI